MGECSRRGLGGRILTKGTIPEKVSELQNDEGFLNPESLAKIILAGIDDRRAGGAFLVELSKGLSEAQKKEIRENLGIYVDSKPIDPTPPDPDGDKDPDGDGDGDNTGGDKYEDVDPDDIEW